MGTKIVEITVKLVLKEDADVQEVVSEMDYQFTHPAIVDTEVVDVNNEL